MREFVCLSSIEMDMEALIKKPRPVLETAHQDLNNRRGLELIGHRFIDFLDIFLKKSGSATGLRQRIDRKRTAISC